MKPLSARAAQRGFSLIVVMLLLVIATVLGVAAAQRAIVNERGARNDHDTEVAFQAAEAALADAERDVLGPNESAQQRLCLFDGRNVMAFVAGCGGAGRQQGLCAPSEHGAEPAWMGVDFSAGNERSVRFGSFTGRAYVTGDASTGTHVGALPALPPRYVVEAVRSRGGWDPNRLQGADANSVRYLYRVTAIGYGMREETQVVLQTSLHKPTASPGCPFRG